MMFEDQEPRGGIPATRTAEALNVCLTTCYLNSGSVECMYNPRVSGTVGVWSVHTTMFSLVTPCMVIQVVFIILMMMTMMMMMKIMSYSYDDDDDDEV
jgi:hypothetical protein